MSENSVNTRKDFFAERYVRLVSKRCIFEQVDAEQLLRKVDEMTDIKYEKESSFLDGMDAKAREMAKAMLAEGDSVEKVARISQLSEAEVAALKQRKRRCFLQKPVL